ncbi:hypothetical protein [Aureibaculum luteum]|uniref:hypothetical protein n=1 Tax=Aureibaculum luteum TaxID=1548456 RepID=UPI000E4C922B|nr:hypothetical protein [Aureibaculum luteum]
MDKEEKIKRLKALLERIDDYSNTEYNFDVVDGLLKKEIKYEENEEIKTTSYLMYLNEVLNEDVFRYKTALKRSPKKGAITEYKSLIGRFTSVVYGELSCLKLNQ